MSIDAVYIFRHSRHEDEELRYSLRSVARHMSWIRKIWIFGDRPEWLSDKVERIEHVPHEKIAWIGGYSTPVVNTFLMHYLIALLPNLTPEYVFFCDDYILLQDLELSFLKQVRFLSDMTAKTRGTGVFTQALWRTHDFLKRRGYEGKNYEVHLPIVLTKDRVLNAFRDLRDYATEDRFYGLLAQTAILNHARKHEGFPVVHLESEQTYAGIHRAPISRSQIEERCAGRTFLNFDDEGFNDELRAFLQSRFPDTSPFEKGGLSCLRDAPEQDRSIPSDQDLAIGLRRTASPLEERDFDASRCAIVVTTKKHFASNFESNLLKLQAAGHPVHRLLEGPDLDVARSRLATELLNQGIQEFFWIDSDIGFQTGDVERVRRSGLPLAVSLYPRVGKRAFDFRPLSGTRELQFGTKGGWIEILGAPTGFMHVRRIVFDVIRESRSVSQTDDHLGRSFYPFFTSVTKSVQGRFLHLSDGFAFCDRARNAGIAIAADTSLRLWKTGEYAYSWEEAGKEHQRFANYSYRLAPQQRLDPNLLRCPT